ncbi:uncharacterized protein LOC113322334 [Papaver somniferum]|uniref:uncharacterized protein LOC113322334 n=1 Tax=Papaver somniferum TaxID=3469 RepID=UPI000E703AC9|nr:uncharacterized protein LOC113322334 [Papaver somniferum]
MKRNQMGDHYEKKAIGGGGWEQTTPRRNNSSSYFNIGGIRNLTTWFFIVCSLSYILYSSNLLLTNEQQGCVYTTSTISSSTDVAAAVVDDDPTTTLSSSFTNSSSSDSLVSLKQDVEEEDRDKTRLMQTSSIARFDDTELKHVFFCIAASSKLWEQRKEYIKQWWRPRVTRGIVWLDKRVRTRRNENLPEIRISGDTRRFRYSNRQGSRSALRISRVVSETLRLGLKDVRWFVMGDDDTVFFVDNVVGVLSKYDHRQYYYIGSSSESHVQNIFFSYSMAYGGGGFAISYPLAVALEKIQDRCMNRYPGLYGSDDRIQACMAELGVPLTKETGFHQYDVYGDLLGLLAAHPVAPLVSLHHLDVVDPIFPKMKRAKAVEHLFEGTQFDSSSIMQQSICYSKKHAWSISVSWGYVVQILRGVMSPRELEMPTRTFLNWYKRADYTAYAFNTRPVTKHPCQKPFIYYMSTVRYDRAKKQTISVYIRRKEPHPYCRWKMESPEKIDSIVVIKKPDPLRWRRSPRRDCCRVLPMSKNKSSTMYIAVEQCRPGEISEF